MQLQDHRPAVLLHDPPAHGLAILERQLDGERRDFLHWIIGQQPAGPQLCLGGFDPVLGRPLAVDLVASVDLLAERVGVLGCADQPHHLLPGARLVRRILQKNAQGIAEVQEDGFEFRRHGFAFGHGLRG